MSAMGVLLVTVASIASSCCLVLLSALPLVRFCSGGASSFILCQ